jgi:LysR family transcriptional regulator, transcriptional activator for aaeXAB operon
MAGVGRPYSVDDGDGQYAAIDLSISVKFFYTVDLRRMAIFAAVVDAKSMHGAARTLGLTPSAVSQQIRQLERETNVVLLNRSTRHLQLTTAGEAFYAGCQAMVEAARDAHERLLASRDAVAGELRISAPVGFASTHLAPALAPLLTAHPRLSLSIVATDEVRDLGRERVDVAIVIGVTPPTTTYIRRHLADWANLLVAAPSYLDAHGTPKTPGDLASHALVSLPTWHHAADILTGPRGEQARMPAARRITCNNQLTIRQLTLAGCGLSLHVEPEIADELKSGRLVRVLADWALPLLGVDALVLPRTAQLPRVRAVVDACRAYVTGLGAQRRLGRRLTSNRRRTSM